MTRQLLECLLRIRSPEFTAYVEYLKARHEKARDDCAGLSGEMLLRAQGRAAELKEQLNQIEQSVTLIDKYKSSH
jgi:hypothetical protein